MDLDKKKKKCLLKYVESYRIFYLLRSGDEPDTPCNLSIFQLSFV